MKSKQKAIEYFKSKIEGYDIPFNHFVLVSTLDIAIAEAKKEVFDDFKKKAKMQVSVSSPKPSGYFMHLKDFDKLEKRHLSTFPKKEKELIYMSEKIDVNIVKGIAVDYIRKSKHWIEFCDRIDKYIKQRKIESKTKKSTNSSSKKDCYNTTCALFILRTGCKHGEDYQCNHRLSSPS